MSDPSWYYSQNGDQFGPVAASELKELAASGELRPNDLVWKEGAADWRPAREVRGLFPRLNGDKVTDDDVPPERSDASSPIGVRRRNRPDDRTSPGLWDEVVNGVRQRVPPLFLENVSSLLARWGVWSLFVAVFLLPTYLVLTGFRTDRTVYFAYAIGAFALLAVAQFVARKMIDTVPLLVDGTPSRIAGSGFLDVLAHIFCLSAGAMIGSWIYTAVTDEPEFAGLIYVIAGSMPALYSAALCLHPKMINVVTTESTSIGEEAVGVVSAWLKIILCSVPVNFGLNAVVGTSGLLVALLLSFLSAEWQSRSLSYARSSGILVAGAVVWPLMAYLLGIFFYMFLDVIRSILLLPQKIDRLADVSMAVPPQPERDHDHTPLHR